MPKTFQNLIDEARDILQDTDSASYRYTTQLLVNKLNRGLHELARIRPDAFWSYFLRDDIIVPEVVFVDSDPDDDEESLAPVEDGQVALEANFKLPMQFWNPLVFWVAGSAELVDDEFTNDGRAITLITQFKAQCIGL